MSLKENVPWMKAIIEYKNERLGKQARWNKLRTPVRKKDKIKRCDEITHDESDVILD